MNIKCIEKRHMGKIPHTYIIIIKELKRIESIGKRFSISEVYQILIHFFRKLNTFNYKY